MLEQLSLKYDGNFPTEQVKPLGLRSNLAGDHCMYLAVLIYSDEMPSQVLYFLKIDLQRYCTKRPIMLPERQLL